MLDNTYLFNKKTFIFLILPIIATYLIDTSLIKIYDIVDKYFISADLRILLFSLNSLTCLFLQYFILNYLKIFSSKTPMKLNFKPMYLISLICICLSGVLITLMIFQMYFYHYYDKNIIQIVQIMNYAIASFFIVKLSTLFISWFKLQKKLIFLLYFITISLIAFNLLITSYYVTLKINDRPQDIREYVGASIDISHGKYSLLEITYKISSIISFIFMWIATGVLLTNYKDRPVKTIASWVLLSVPLIYFILTYFGQPIFSFLLFPYLTEDPIFVSIILTVFQTLSKPIGGLTFVILFWSISRSIRYEKDIRIFMAIAGIGVMLMFATNQATNLTVVPYPPFGISTITILNIASFLMLLGIYYSAILASVNVNLRRSINKHATDSKLLDLIGYAEMEKEIQKTVTKILQDNDVYRKSEDLTVELDEDELKKYLDQLIQEAKKSREKT